MPARKKRKPPKPGSTFVKRYHGKSYTLTVVEDKGRILYRLGNNSFTSPSSAGKHITGGEINGWKFWKIES